MKKNLFVTCVVGIPLALIFLAFFNPAHGGLVNKSVLVFTALSVPYCLLVKDPKKGLLLFLLQASLLEGPWKVFTAGTNLKLLVYVIRDLLLYASFINFCIHKKRILSEDVLREKPPYAPLIFVFLINIFIQIFNPAGCNYLNSIAGSRLFWEMLPLYWMGFYLMRDKDSFKILCWALLLCIFFNAAATILQHNMGSEKVASICRGYYIMIHHWGRIEKGVLRPPGLGADMGFTGFYFSQFFVVALVLFFIRKARKLYNRWLNFAILAALCIAGLAGLIASAARSAILTTIVSLIILFLLRRELITSKLIKTLILSALVSFLLVPYMLRTFKTVTKRYETIRTPKVLLHTMFEEERSRIQQAFSIPIQYSVMFFFGNGLGRVGPGGYMFARGAERGVLTNSENTFNLSITEIGTIGTFIWLIFHIIIIRRGYGIYKNIKDPEWKWYAMAPLAYMLLILLFWQFGQLISFPQNAGFWFASGTLMGLRYLRE